MECKQRLRDRVFCRNIGLGLLRRALLLLVLSWVGCAQQPAAQSFAQGQLSEGEPALLLEAEEIGQALPLLLGDLSQGSRLQEELLALSEGSAAYGLLVRAEHFLGQGEGKRAEEYLLAAEALGVRQWAILPGLLRASLGDGRYLHALHYLDQADGRLQSATMLRLAVELELALEKGEQALRDASLLIRLQPTERSLELYVECVEAFMEPTSQYQALHFAAALSPDPRRASSYKKRAEAIESSVLPLSPMAQAPARSRGK